MEFVRFFAMKPVFNQDRLRQAPGRVQPLLSNEEHRVGSPQVNAALKSWFDNVIIPNLIKLYLAAQDAPETAQEPALAGTQRRFYTRPDSERKQ